MRLLRLQAVQVLRVMGDCDRYSCGHSIVYHVPIFGCLKCDCSEYK